MTVLAVLDTNVIVSAQITKNANSPTVRIFRAILDGTITPLYHPEILTEYQEVLSRPKFKLQAETIRTILAAIVQYGIEATALKSGIVFQDEGDRIFYEVVLSKRDENARLITGNIRHFPQKSFIVTPAELVKILGL